MSHNYFLRRVLWLLMCLLLVSCGNKEEEERAAQQAAAARKAVLAAQKAAQLAREKDPLLNMGRAVLLTRVKGDVEVYYDIASVPVLNENIEVKIGLKPLHDAQALSAEVSASKALVISGETQLHLDAVKAGQPTLYNILINSAVEGLQLINIQVSIVRNEVTSVKDFSIPVIFSKPEPEPEPKPESGSGSTSEQPTTTTDTAAGTD